MANVFNAKVNEIWYMLARFNVEKLNNENRKSILHPPLHGATANKICRKSILLVIFSISRLGQCPGTCKKPSLIAATLTDAWQEPGTILAMNWRIEGGVGSRNLVGGNGRTRHKPAELTWRKPGTQRNIAEPSGAAEPSGTRRNPAKPGGTRRNPAEPAGFRRVPPGFAGFW